MNSDDKLLQQVRNFLVVAEADMDQTLENLATCSASIEYVNQLDPAVVKDPSKVVALAKKTIGAAQFDNLTLILFLLAGRLIANKGQKQLRDELEVTGIR